MASKTIKTKSVQGGAEGRVATEQSVLTESQRGLLISRAALTRAVASIEAKLKDEGIAVGSLPEGGYEVGLTAVIRGDVTVGAAGVSRSEPKPAVSDRELLCALLAGKTLGAVRKSIAAAVEILREARKTGPRQIKAAKEIQVELETASDNIDESVKSECASAGLMTEPRETPRAGAVSGKPRVSIEGHASGHTLDVRVGDDD